MRTESAALIIATGYAPCGGHNYKVDPLKKVGTITAIERLVRVFQRADVERIVAVYDGKAVKPEYLASHMGIEYLGGSDDADILENVKIGLAYLSDKCDFTLITHVARPLFKIETVRALMEMKTPLCVPSHNGRAGYPLLLRSSHFQAFLHGSRSFEEAMNEAATAVGLKRVFVNVPDE